MKSVITTSRVGTTGTKLASTKKVAIAESSAVMCVQPLGPANNSLTLALNPRAIDKPSSFW